MSVRVTIASRVRVASIMPTDDSEANVPFYRRFFLGGSSSIRGWGRFDVSPLVDGFPIGGLSMLEGSTEVRLPLRGKFGGGGVRRLSATSGANHGTSTSAICDTPSGPGSATRRRSVRRASTSAIS